VSKFRPLSRVFEPAEVDDLIEELAKDHTFICNKLADGDIDTPTNSGDAIECIQYLRDQLDDAEREVKTHLRTVEQLDEDKDELEKEKAAADAATDAAECRALELEEAVITALTYLRLKDYDSVVLTLERVKTEQEFRDPKAIREKYAAAMAEKQAQVSLNIN